MNIFKSTNKFLQARKIALNSYMIEDSDFEPLFRFLDSRLCVEQLKEVIPINNVYYDSIRSSVLLRDAPILVGDCNVIILHKKVNTRTKKARKVKISHLVHGGSLLLSEYIDISTHNQEVAILKYKKDKCDIILGIIRGVKASD